MQFRRLRRAFDSLCTRLAVDRDIEAMEQVLNSVHANERIIGPKRAAEAFRTAMLVLQQSSETQEKE